MPCALHTFTRIFFIFCHFVRRNTKNPINNVIRMHIYTRTEELINKTKTNFLYQQTQILFALRYRNVFYAICCSKETFQIRNVLTAACVLLCTRRAVGMLLSLCQSTTDRSNHSSLNISGGFHLFLWGNLNLNNKCVSNCHTCICLYNTVYLTSKVTNFLTCDSTQYDTKEKLIKC